MSARCAVVSHSHAYRPGALHYAWQTTCCSERQPKVRRSGIHGGRLPAELVPPAVSCQSSLGGLRSQSVQSHGRTTKWHTERLFLISEASPPRPEPRRRIDSTELRQATVRHGQEFPTSDAFGSCGRESTH